MLKPLGKFLIVQVQKEEKQTSSGIFLADTSSFEKTKKGLVLAVGNDISDIYAQEYVLFPKECGTAVKHNGEEYIVLNKDNILAVVEDD